MNSSELCEAFRDDVVDTAKPYLWSDTEVYRYENDAYRMFVRLTGGIADASSDLTVIDVVAGERRAEISPLILNFREAELASDERLLKIINHTDFNSVSCASDYGSLRTMYRRSTPGRVVAMVIGKERGIVEWVQVPVVNDRVNLTVYRLPLQQITGEDQELSEIGDEHHEHLLLWMKHRAYAKQDAETFDKGRSEDFKREFEEYCAFAKAEAERYKAKPRFVQYGGV